MIQVNLVPMERRIREGSVAPLFFTVLIGLASASFLGGWYHSLAGELDRAAVEKRALEEARVTWTEKKEEVDGIAADIDLMERRQQTIINISRSKIAWSLKLEQLSKIFQAFPNIRTRGMTMKQEPAGGRLFFDCTALNDDYSEVAEFRELLKRDAAFFFHFERLLSPKTRRIRERDGEPERLAFQPTLLIKSFEDQPQTRRR